MTTRAERDERRREGKAEEMAGMFGLKFYVYLYPGTTVPEICCEGAGLRVANAEEAELWNVITRAAWRPDLWVPVPPV